MMPDPVVSFTTLTPGGIEHVSAVHTDDTSLFVITADAFVTDALSPDAGLFEMDTSSDTKAPSEFAHADFADLPREALLLMAGHRALQLTIVFREGYLPFEALIDPDEPTDDNSGFDDDDLNSDEGVLL
jgi:hypothetical protein